MLDNWNEWRDEWSGLGISFRIFGESWGNIKNIICIMSLAEVVFGLAGHEMTIVYVYVLSVRTHRAGLSRLHSVCGFIDVNVIGFYVGP